MKLPIHPLSKNKNPVFVSFEKRNYFSKNKEQSNFSFPEQVSQYNFQV
jgi:hypothetical protein